MKCPYCHGEMEHGYIQCRDGVYWAEKKRMVAALPPVKKASVDLRAIGDGGCQNYAIAWNCPVCKKIVIDYAELSAGE